MDDLKEFAVWKGYPLPELNADGQFDKEWLHREWVAFRAGLARRAVPQANAEQDVSQWEPVTGPGQVKKGDKLRFTIGDKSYKETARLILHPGTDKEEVIYNKYQNFYFITAGIGSFSNHKNVEFLAASNAASASKTTPASGEGGNG